MGQSTGGKVDGRPGNFGDYAERGFIAETRDGLPWWDTCIASALIDLARVPGFITAFAGIAWVLRHDGDPDWVVGGSTPRAAMKVAMEWLDAGIDPGEVAWWLRAGCWDPKVAMRFVAAGIHPMRLLNEDGLPAHWAMADDGTRIPLVTAVSEWDYPMVDAVRWITGRGYEVRASDGPGWVG